MPQQERNATTETPASQQQPQKLRNSPFTIQTEVAIQTQLGAKFKEAKLDVPEDTVAVLASRIYSLAEKDSSVDIDKKVLQTVSSIKAVVGRLSGIKDDYARKWAIESFFGACTNPDFASWAINKPQELNAILDRLSGIKDDYARKWAIESFFGACTNPDFASWAINKPQELNAILDRLSGIKDDEIRWEAIECFLFACIKPDFASLAISNSEKLADTLKTVVDRLSGIKDDYARGQAISSFFHTCVNPDFASWATSNSEKFTDALKIVVDTLSGIKDDETRGQAIWSFLHACTNPDFANWLTKKARPADEIMIYYRALSGAIELGRPLDDLHEQPKERADYLKSLSTNDVLSLLLSNPEFFYTSSNHMLFDRLKSDLKKSGTTIDAFFDQCGVFEMPALRNFAFRMANYDRLYGKPDSLFSAGPGLNKIFECMIAPLDSGKYDEGYFYLLANALASLKGSPLSGQILQVLKEKTGSGDERFNKAAEFLADFLEDRVRASGKATFRRESYLGANKKLQILQIFDKEDVGGFNWQDSQGKASRYGQKKTGPDGELVYENSSTKITLYMGEDGEQNQAFVKSFLGRNPNAIITFRGHSFSLNENFPSNIFENRKGNILFIPGSCGSAGSVPAFKSENPDTSLTFISNTSTGRGQVTEALLDILINTTKPTSFKNLLESNESRISALDGDIRTIKVYSLGEQLLDYVAEK